MQKKLRKIMAERANGDRGFTLIELLVVVVIIGVLVAIAIPLYLNYRKGAENTSASSDVRGAISAVEQFYTENGNQYPADAQSANGTLTLTTTGGGTATVNVSDGNDVRIKNNTNTYVICAQNSNGQTIYVYNSANSKSVAKSQSADLATCLTSGQ